MIMTNGPLWYAVHTHPREELKALAHLQRQNYRVYLPCYAKKIRHARKNERVVRPFFPRYLFVHLNLATMGWRSIRSTIGVSDIVCFGDQPAPLPTGVIETLRSQEDAEGLIQMARKNLLKPGDSIVVLSGPFARQLGLCDGVSDNERVAILLDLLGRKVRVVLDVEAVEAA
jgi:transcriptional antiterminator RfaH